LSPPPLALAQRRADVAFLAPGDTTPNNVVLSAVIAGETDAVLEIEVAAVGAPFTGTPTSTSAPFWPGSRVFHDYTGLFSPGTSYRWKARQVDANGPSIWVSFGGNGEEAADFLVQGAPPLAPFDLAQQRQDLTAIELGGLTPRNPLLSAVIAGYAGAALQLEVVPVGEPFTGEYNWVIDSVPPGTRGVFQMELSPGVAYRWKARQVSSAFTSDWVSFGGNPDDEADFVVEGGPPTLPPPTGLAQWRADGTPIPVDGWAPGKLGLSAVITGSGLEIEMRPVSEPFTGVPTSVTGPVAPGTAEVHLDQSLFTTLMAYHWRARQVNETGASEWASFGGNEDGAPDFRIDDLPPTISIAGPSSGTVAAGTSSVSVEGVSSDNVSLAAVIWRNLMSGATGTADGTTSWAAQVPLVDGLNVIQVQAVDHVGLTASSVIRVRRPSQ
jgi:hypothetical protein